MRRPPPLPIPSYTDVVVGDIVTTCDQEERHCQNTEDGRKGNWKESESLGCNRAAKSTLRPPTSLLNKH